MTKRIFLYLSLLAILFCACQSEHERQTAMLHELLDACERYDTMPNDSDARAVLYYMERYGSPAEQQQAWRMMAKIYKRHGALFGEDFAYQMAMDCVDSTSTDFDMLAVAEILGEWSMNRYYALDNGWYLAESAKNLAKAAGDSVAYYRYMGQEAFTYIMPCGEEQPNTNVQDALCQKHSQLYHDLAKAETAFRRLWQLGRKDLAADAFSLSSLTIIMV